MMRTSGRTASSPARSQLAGIVSGANPIKLRLLTVMVGVCLLFAAVSLQLVRLGLSAGPPIMASQVDPIAATYARPDIVDRNGRLIATDVAVPSLFADPHLVADRDELTEKLGTVLPGLDTEHLRRTLSDLSRRFVWVRRGLAPRTAQKLHNLGLPGLAFRDELRRAYPMGSVAGHLIGTVDIDNRGVSGLERYIDEAVGVEGVHGATQSASAPVRLSIDIGVQHSLESELDTALRRFKADAAAGLIMDVVSGEVLAAASLPGVDPGRPQQAQQPGQLDRLTGGVYELGSIFKMVTVAMALEDGKSLDAMVDTSEPLTAGRYTIADPHPLGRPMSVAEVFIRSSNVGAGLLALEAGPERQRAFIDRLGLGTQMKTEAGPVAAPKLPRELGRAEQITMSYGHGLALAPLQFAAAAAALVNGGTLVHPTFLHRNPGDVSPGAAVVTAKTSAKLNELMRLNVTDPAGTGRRADVPGFKVGGKTGTAEMPGVGGYREKAVISSFLAVFPMDAPRYVVLVSLFEPKGTEAANGDVLAGLNAAPTAGRIIGRVAPQLGLFPDGAVAEVAE